MRDEGPIQPVVGAGDRHPAAALLSVEAIGLVVVAGAVGAGGAVVTAALFLVLAAVAAGLAASIAEGFPHTGAAVAVFEGVALAVALSARSTVAAVAVLAATALTWWWQRQMRRPVSCQ